MPAQDFRSLTNFDLERNRIINAGFELFTSGLPPAPFKGQFGFSEVSGQSPDHAGVYVTTAPAGWMWFARIGGAETITGFWTFNTSSGSPFSVNNNTTKVTGLNADLLDGFNSERDTFGADSVAVRYTAGRLLVGTPVAANDAVTKAYADNLSSGNRPIGAVKCATTSAVVGSYSSATDSITSSGNGAIANFASVFDSLTLVLNDRVLCKDQTSQFANGVYYVSDVGSAGTPFVLKRTLDADEPAEVTTGATVTVGLGTINKGRKYRQSQPIANIDTDPEVWVLDSVTDLIAGPGIVIDGTKISFVDSTGYGRSSLFVSKDTATVPNTIVEQLTFVANKVLRSDATKPYWGDFPTVVLPTLEHKSSSSALTILPAGPQTQGASPLLWTYTIDANALVSFGTPPANTVNISAPTAGSGNTSLRSNATLQLDVGIAPSWTSVHVFGAGLSTLATEKASPGFFATYEDDPSGSAQPLRWTALASVRTSLKVPNPAIPANLVGIAAKAVGSTAQGTAYIAHDATLEIDQTISPLWKGLHTWFNSSPSAHAIATKTNESGTARFAITAGGELWWGDGGGAMDAKLSRGVAGELIQDASASTAMLSIYGLKLAAPTFNFPTVPFTHVAVWTSSPATTRVQLQSITNASFLTGIGGVPTGRQITISAGGYLSLTAVSPTQDLSSNPSWTISLAADIAPTWTQKHTFQPATAIPSIAVRVQPLGTAIGAATRFLGVAADAATNAQNVVQVLASDLTTYLNLSTYALKATTLTLTGAGLVTTLAAPVGTDLSVNRAWTITVPASHPHSYSDVGGIIPPALLGRTTTATGAAELIAASAATLSLTSQTLAVVSAPKWTTARSFTWTGDATGSMASVDGSGDYTTPLTVAWANSYPTLDTKYVPLTRTLTIVGAGIATAVAAPAGSDLSVNRTWTITVPATDLSGAAPITRTITHSSGGTAHLTITAAPAGADLTVNRTWTHTVIAAPKLTGSTVTDGFTLPTALQFFVFQNTTASVNFPTSFGGGVRFERGATTSSYGSFQLWSQLIADPAKAELWFSKFVDVGTWSPWKKFVFVGDTTSGFVPETRTLTMTGTAPNITVTNSGTAMPLSASQAWTFTVNSAPKWAAAMTLTATTELSGVATFDGSAAANFPLTIDRAINATWTGFHTFNAGITIKAATTTLSTTSQVMITDLDASATPRDVRQVTVQALRGQMGQPTLAAGAIGYGDGSNLLTGAANELGWDAANNRMFLATSTMAAAVAGYVEHDGLRPYFTNTTPTRRGIAFLDDIDFTNDASASEATRLRFNSPSTGKYWAESQIPGVIGTGDYSFAIRLRWPTVPVAANSGVWCLSNHAADGAAANDMGGYIALTNPTSLILFARDSGAGFILSTAIPMTKWFGRVIDIVVTRTAGVENCYINGEQQTYTRSSQVANSLTGNPLKIRIGSMHTGVLPFPESIYRARFYNRSLSLDEVIELARSGVRMSDRWGTTSPSVAGCIIDIDLGAAYQSGSSIFSPDTSLRYNATVYGTYDKLPGHFHDSPSIAGQAAAVPYFGSNGRMIADATKLSYDGTTFSVFGQAYIQAAAAIGVTVPTTPVAWLELAAGSTTRAPLRLGVGTFTSALTSGSIENNGVRPWYTTSTPTRRGLAFVDELNFSNDPSSERAGAVVFGPNDNVTSRLWDGTTNTQVIGTGPCTLYARIMVPEVQRGPGYDCIAFVGPTTTNFLGNSMSMALHSNGNLYCFVSINSTDHVRLILANLISNYGGKVVDLIFTRDGTTSPGSLYVDGVLQNITPSTGGAGNPWNLSLNSVYFIVGQGSSGQGSVPRIYRAALFNRYLSAADARALTLYGTHSSDMWGSQIAAYTSNFTAGADSWVPNSNMTVVGNIDTGVDGAGVPPSDDWLRSNNSIIRTHSPYRASVPGLIGGPTYRAKASCFVPVGSVMTHAFFSGLLPAGAKSSTALVAGAETIIENEFVPTTTLLSAYGNTSSSITPGNIAAGSSLYLKNIILTRLGALVDLDLAIGCGSAIPDLSGRYHGAINGTTWYHLIPTCPIGLPSGGGEVSYGLRRFVQKGVALTAATIITHNLGTKYVEVQCWQDDIAIPAKIELGVTVESDNTIKIWPTIIPVGAKATVIVVG